MKVALIHDHLAQDGGAEKVLKAFCELYPDAPIYTLLSDKENVERNYPGRTIFTSVIQRLPGGVTHYQWYMPFMPMAVEFFDLRHYDLVLSDASAFAKGVITSTDTLHICYCHTPTRYLWDYTHQYIKELRFNKYFKKFISLLLDYVRLWDRQAADRVDVFIANSKTVEKRIKKYYRRDSTVIYPPVDTKRFSPPSAKGDYFLIGGRLSPYKRVDIVVQAFLGLDKKLKIYGDGVDLKRLKEIAGNASNIEFLGRVADDQLPELYSHALAFLYPQEEDFGITAVEAMAAGRPVIALKKGGAAETVIEGVTGEFFLEQTPAAIREAILRFDPERYDPARIRAQAEKFSKERFLEEMRVFIGEEYRKFKAS